MAEELADIRGRLPAASEKSDHDLAIHRGLEEKGLARYAKKVQDDSVSLRPPPLVLGAITELLLQRAAI